MKTVSFDAIEAFRRKTGQDVQNLPAIWFRDVKKPVALARLALWTAISDVWKCSHDMSAGQIDTVIDLSPLIVGNETLKELGDVKAVEGIIPIVKKNADDWEFPAVAAAQLWSLGTAANGKFPSELFRNSACSDADLAMLGAMATCVRSDRHLAHHPHALWTALQTNSLAPKEEALNALRNGAFEAFAYTGAAQDMVEQLDKTVDRIGTKADTYPGAFLGPKDLNQIRSLYRPRLAKEELVGYLYNVPYGQYVVAVSRRYANHNKQLSDLVSAGLDGYERALQTYSPLFRPDVSVHDAAPKNGRPNDLSLFERFAVDAGDAGSEKDVLSCARFSGYAKGTYMHKALVKELGVCVGMEIPDHVQKLSRQMSKVADEIKKEEELPWAECVDFAAAVVRRQGCEPEDLQLASNLVRYGQSMGVSLDARDKDDGDSRDLHEMLPDDVQEDAKHDWERLVPPQTSSFCDTLDNDPVAGRGNPMDRLSDVYAEVVVALRKKSPELRSMINRLCESQSTLNEKELPRLLAGVREVCPGKMAEVAVKGLNAANALSKWSGQGESFGGRLAQRTLEAVIKVDGLTDRTGLFGRA